MRTAIVIAFLLLSACASKAPAASTGTGSLIMDAHINSDGAGTGSDASQDATATDAKGGDGQIADGAVSDSAVADTGITDAGMVLDVLLDAKATDVPAMPDITAKPDVAPPPDAGPGWAASKGGCAPWFGQGCGGCACEKAVCGADPDCCNTLWGQGCAAACGDMGGQCLVPDAGPTDTGPDVADSGAFKCQPTYTGTIPGANLDLSQTACVFSIAKLGGKFPLPYKLIVGDAVPMWSTDTNIGQCAPKTVFGGIATFVTVEGIGDGLPQKWCLCDVGNCVPPKDTAFTPTAPGTYQHDFVWDGNNFDGPSDTNTQPGAPFPPGEYTLSVTSQGNFKKADGTEDGFGAAAKLQILLTP